MTRAVLGAVLVGLVAAACARASSVPAAAPAGPAFRVQTLDGRTVVPPGPNDPPMVLFFMAAWCSSCAIPAGELAQIRKDYGPRAPTILALDVDPSDTAADLRAFARGIKDADYHWAMDQGGAMVRVFGVTALDTTVILAPGGRVAVRRDGPIRYAALQRELDKLLP